MGSLVTSFKLQVFNKGELERERERLGLCKWGRESLGIDLRERFGMEEEDKGEMCVERRERVFELEREEKSLELGERMSLRPYIEPR